MSFGLLRVGTCGTSALHAGCLRRYLVCQGSMQHSTTCTSSTWAQICIVSQQYCTIWPTYGCVDHLLKTLSTFGSKFKKPIRFLGSVTASMTSARSICLSKRTLASSRARQPRSKAWCCLWPMCGKHITTHIAWSIAKSEQCSLQMLPWSCSWQRTRSWQHFQVLMPWRWGTSAMWWHALCGTSLSTLQLKKAFHICSYAPPSCTCWCSFVNIPRLYPQDSFGATVLKTSWGSSAKFAGIVPKALPRFRVDRKLWSIGECSLLCS